jgi:hypothetical protein
VAPEIRGVGTGQAAEAGAARNALAVQAAAAVTPPPTAWQTRATPDCSTEAASEAPASWEAAATQPVPAAEEEAVAIMVAVGAAAAYPVSIGATQAGAGAGDHRTSSGVPPTYICGKAGKIQRATD